MTAPELNIADRIDVVADGGESLEFEQLQLLSGLDQLKILCTLLGWRYRGGPVPGDEYRVIVRPPAEHRVKRYKLVYQDDRLVAITVQYRTPNRARVRLCDRYTASHRAHNNWAMCDARRHILVLIDVAGTRLQVIHTGALRERDEVARLYRTLLPDA